MDDIIKHRYLFYILNTFVLLNLTSSHTEFPLILLISFDGFRWDYLQMAKQQGFKTPNFDRLIKDGVVIGEGGLKNIFPTKTFPNHYSLVTGLYAENHGLVGNVFFDPVFKEPFIYDRSEERKWWDGMTGSKHGAEPIWVTNERNGGGRASGSYMWPGSVVDQQRPYYTRCGIKDSETTKHESFISGVDTVVRWFTDDVRPINLGLLYIGEPDHTGHWEGAGSMAVMKKIEELDKVLEHLLESLEGHNLLDRMNIILTSDHGMINMTKTIYLDEYIDSALYTYFGQSPIWNIQPLPGKDETVFKSFQAIPDLAIFKAEEFPEELHYGKNRRVLKFIVLASEGVQFCQTKNDSGCNIKANHGYNNSLPSMHPIFIAHGPVFKKNFTSKPFDNVDLYPLMCHILGVSPHDNDGNLHNIIHILEEDGIMKTLEMDRTLITVLISVGCSAMVSVICCVAVVRSVCIYQRTKKHDKIIRRLSPECLDLAENGSQNVQPLLGSEDEDFA